MAVVKNKVRVVGNGRKAIRRNAPILGLALNSGRLSKGGQTLATKKKDKKKAAGRKTTKRTNSAKKSVIYMQAKKGKPTKRRNSAGSSIADAVVGAVVIITAAVVSKVATQAVLGEKNTGPMGYLGNMLAGGALWFGAKQITRNQNVLNAIIGGTAVQVVLRATNDYTPLGKFVKDLGVGDYQVQSYVQPQILKDPHRSAEIAVPEGWGRGEVIMAPPMAATAGMAGLYSGTSTQYGY